jgi:hypothetical protein
MKITQITLLALACSAAPLAVQAGIDIGINLGGPEVVIQGRPPQERIEVIPLSPGPGYFWIRGHWAWRHEHWEWISGRYERPAQPGGVWIAGQWVARGNGWVWIEGHYSYQPAYQPGPPPGAPVGDVEVVASEAPPAPLFEAVPYAPGPDFFWIGGHWNWNGRWVWVHGRYDRHPHFHPGAGWEAGRWDRRGGSWVWHEGHWR